MAAFLSKFGRFFSFLALVLIAYSAPALATGSVSDIAGNMTSSAEDLPGFVSAISYMLGLLLGVLGVLKLKDHVENPSQTPLRVGLIRLLIGGSLFALPIVYEALVNTIGNDALNIDNNSIANDISGLLGNLTGNLFGTITLPTVNGILTNILDSIKRLPGLISAVSYLLGLIIAVQGLLKLKDHVENPDQTPLKEGVIRLLVAGALLAIPTIYNAMFDLVGGNGLGIIGNVTALLGGVGFLYSSYAQTLCDPTASTVSAVTSVVTGSSGPSMGDSLCGIILYTGAFPAFLTAVSYLIGLVMGVWAIFKLRDHVLNPQQTGISEGVSRLIAGGFFFALPIVVEVARSSLGATTLLSASALAPVTRYNDGSDGFLNGLLGGNCSGGNGVEGLDGILGCFMTDMMGPLHVVLNFFAFCAGLILLMIGISRLIKSAQDGPRGPGGLGTIMTFVTGGALISYNEMVRAFSTTLMGSPVTAAYGTLQYTDGMSSAELTAAHTTISAIEKFIIIVGLISFVRGIFIVRGVAEGNQQSSIMAGMTHIVGGALAVNVGPLLNAVQSTLGIGQYGLAFTL